MNKQSICTVYSLHVQEPFFARNYLQGELYQNSYVHLVETFISFLHVWVSTNFENLVYVTYMSSTYTLRG